MHVKGNGVEIRDWTRVMGRRLSLLVVIPIAAMLIAGILAVLEPQAYRATATVILPQQETSGPLSSAVSQFVADFEGSITSDGVAQATFEATGEPKSAINAGITTRRESTSGVVEVTYTGTNAERAGAVAETAARIALAQIAQIQLDVIQAQYKAADEAYQLAQEGWLSAAQETRIVDFELFKATAERRLTNALDALGAAQDSGRGVSQAQQRLDQLTTQLTEREQTYNRAQDRLDNAEGARGFLSNELFQSQGIVAQAQENDRIQASPARPTNRILFILRRIMFAGAFGLLLAIALIVLMEFLRPSPLNRIRREAGLPTEPGARRAPGQYVG
jgi:capsular polysaccharide biosynthesis protein